MGIGDWGLGTSDCTPAVDCSTFAPSPSLRFPVSPFPRLSVSSVDHGHLRRLLDVPVVKGASRKKRDLQRREELRGHGHHVGGMRLVLPGTLEVDGARGRAADQVRRARQADGLHTADRGEPLLDLLVELWNALVVITVQRRVHTEEENVGRVEPDVNGAQVAQGVEKQTGAGQQHQ